MLTASVSRRFDIPADRLWDLIGDFGNMAKWTGAKPESCVQEGQGIGSLRRLTLADGRVIVDRLEALGHRSYTYSIVTSPLPYKSYRATMLVSAVDQSASELTWTGEFEPVGLTDDEAIATTKGMYHYGISLMEKSVSRIGEYSASPAT